MVFVPSYRQTPGIQNSPLTGLLPVIHVLRWPPNAGKKDVGTRHNAGHGVFA